MNVQLENLPNCITTMRVEVPSDKVSKVLDAIAREYAAQVRLPGYRPGKAPRAIVEAKFKKEIQEEFRKRMVSDSCREAIAENKLRVLSVQDVEDVELAEDKSFSFNATLVVAPSFELPDYKNLTIELPSSEVTDQEVTEGLDRLREQSADFTEVTDRPVQMDDFAVITYTGTIGGSPVKEVVPSAPEMLSGKDDFWIKLTSDAFLPGFAEKLVGAAVGETREFDLEVGADFPVADLAGKQIHFTVTLNSLKDKVLPELNDEFAAKLVPGKTMDEVKDLVRTELTHQKAFEVDREKRNQIVTKLIENLECELPENMVRYETQRILGEIVRENQSRGISEDLLLEKKSEMLASAAEGARERLRGTFVLVRIAEAEKITVSRDEFKQRVAFLAQRYNQTLEKTWKQLEEADALDRVNEEILTGKVLDFLSSSVSVTVKA